MWERLAGETGIIFTSGAQQEKLIRENVKNDGTHASLENTEAIAYLTRTDPLYKVKIWIDDFNWHSFLETSTTSIPHQQGTNQSLLSWLGLEEGIYLERWNWETHLALCPGYRFTDYLIKFYTFNSVWSWSETKIVIVLSSERWQD